MKATGYLEVGVEEVWLVDPEKTSVEARTVARRRRSSGSHPMASHSVAGLELVPKALFDEALG